MGSAEVRAEPEPLTTMRVLGMDGADQFDNKSQRETLDLMLKRDPVTAKQLNDHIGTLPALTLNEPVVSFRGELDSISKGSKLSFTEQIKETAGAWALDLAVGAPLALSPSAMVYRGSLVGITGLNMMNSRVLVDSIQTERESSKIKERFQSELGPQTVKSIESQCVPSKVDKTRTYLYNMAEHGAVGVISGGVASPFTAGLSLPVMTMAGLGNGALHARTSLALQQSKCEVKEMREKLLKW
jgi:hypothetical protein